jgi:hypothetical protein
MAAAVMVQPFKSRLDLDRRTDERHAIGVEATSRQVEGDGSLYWGATVCDISRSGIGLNLCYPFRAGTYLAVDVTLGGRPRTLQARVVHVQDLVDGTWHVGCEFLRPLSENELNAIK